MRLLEDGANYTVVKALQQLMEFSPNYGWAVTPNLADGVRHILHKVEEGNAFIGHGYLLLVNEFEPWYGRDKVLSEELVLRLPDQPTYNLRPIPYFIEALAKVRGCNIVLAGNSYTSNKLSRIYQSRNHGFKPCSEIFYKVI